MPVLPNPKHERFAQELAKGKTADEAYQLAGYKENRGNAATLKANQIISDRISELLERAAKRAEITVESLTQMLKDDRDLARELGQASAAVSAVDKLGRLHGLVVDKKEVGKPGDFSRMTEDELEEFIARRQDIARASAAGEAASDRSTGMRGKPSGLH